LVLPGTSSAALALLFLSIICLGLWPNIFKRADAKWHFELFSIDFALGSVLLALLAAYTLGTQGSDLGFSDNMLVAGQRAEAVSVLAGMAFALANMCFLATVALIGLQNAALLTFSVFGCGVGLLHLEPGRYVTSSIASIVLAATALLIIFNMARRALPTNPPVRVAASGKPGQVRTSSIRSSQQPKAMSLGAKGSITGVVAGMSLIGMLPLIAIAQPTQLGIGAYGGILLASLGILAATLCLVFFFINIALEGANIGYVTYISGTLKDHVPGFVSGVVWTIGALALFAAYTGAVPLNHWEPWSTPFVAALLTTVTGRLFWRKPPQPKTLLATELFIAGAAVLLIGLRK